MAIIVLQLVYMEAVISRSIKETNAFARALVKRLHRARKAVVIGLLGDLGTGKTTLVQAIARALGVETTVQSPTFVLQKIYELPSGNFSHLVHIDAYRIDDPKELLDLGWNDLVLDAKNVIVVEWADKVQNILPSETTFISLEHARLNDGVGQVSPSERKIIL